MAEKGRFQIPKSFASANSVTRPDRSSILAAAGSVVNTFPDATTVASLITVQTERCRLRDALKFFWNSPSRPFCQVRSWRAVIWREAYAGASRCSFGRGQAHHCAKTLLSLTH